MAYSDNRYTLPGTSGYLKTLPAGVTAPASDWDPAHTEYAPNRVATKWDSDGVPIQWATSGYHPEEGQDPLGGDPWWVPLDKALLIATSIYGVGAVAAAAAAGGGAAAGTAAGTAGTGATMSGMDLAADGALSGGNALSGAYGAGAGMGMGGAGGAMGPGADFGMATGGGGGNLVDAGLTTFDASSIPSVSGIQTMPDIAGLSGGGTAAAGGGAMGTGGAMGPPTAAAQAAGDATLQSQLAPYATGLSSGTAAGGLSGLASSMGISPSMLSTGASLLGGLLGSKGVQSTQTTTKDIPAWLHPYVTGQGGLLDSTNSLLQKQMSPAVQGGYDQMRNTGLGLLNGTTRFGRG